MKNIVLPLGKAVAGSFIIVGFALLIPYIKLRGPFLFQHPGVLEISVALMILGSILFIFLDIKERKEKKKSKNNEGT